MKVHPTIELIFVRTLLIGMFVVFPIFLIWGIWNIFSHEISNNDNSYQVQQAVWIEQGKDAVKTRLKAPSSAEFRNVFFSQKSGTPVTCGEVNSKNSLGGYAGYKAFVSDGGSRTFLADDVDNFAEVWSELCQ